MAPIAAAIDIDSRPNGSGQTLTAFLVLNRCVSMLRPEGAALKGFTSLTQGVAGTSKRNPARRSRESPTARSRAAMRTTSRLPP